MSLAGSAPTIVNGAVRPSANVTVVTGLPSTLWHAGPSRAGWGRMGGASGGAAGTGAPPLAAAITWLLVRISPSADRMMPEPSSFARPRSVSSLTTLGTTLAATCSTEPGGTLAAGMLGAGPADTPVGYCGLRRSWPTAPRHRRYRPTPPQSPLRLPSKLLRGSASRVRRRDCTGCCGTLPVRVVRWLRLLPGGIPPVVGLL